MQPNKTRILVASLVLGGAQLALAADPPAQERDRTYAKVCGFCHDAGVGRGCCVGSPWPRDQRNGSEYCSPCGGGFAFRALALDYHAVDARLSTARA